MPEFSAVPPPQDSDRKSTIPGRPPTRTGPSALPPAGRDDNVAAVVESSGASVAVHLVGSLGHLGEEPGGADDAVDLGEQVVEGGAEEVGGHAADVDVDVAGAL